MEQATALLNDGNVSDANKFYDRAIQIFNRMVNREGKLEFEGRLAKAYALKASTLQRSSDYAAAAAAEDQRIAILKRRLARDPKQEYAEILAYACMDKAWLLRGSLSDPRQALGFYDRAIQIFEGLVSRNELAVPSLALETFRQVGKKDQQVQTLANMLVTRAEVALGLGYRDRARADGKRALTILEQVMNRGDHLASIDDEYNRVRIRLAEIRDLL